MNKKVKDAIMEFDIVNGRVIRKPRTNDWRVEDVSPQEQRELLERIRRGGGRTGMSKDTTEQKELELLHLQKKLFEAIEAGELDDVQYYQSRIAELTNGEKTEEDTLQ